MNMYYCRNVNIRLHTLRFQMESMDILAYAFYLGPPIVLISLFHNRLQILTVDVITIVDIRKIGQPMQVVATSYCRQMLQSSYSIYELDNTSEVKRENHPSGKYERAV